MSDKLNQIIQKQQKQVEEPKKEDDVVDSNESKKVRRDR